MLNWLLLAAFNFIFGALMIVLSRYQRSKQLIYLARDTETTSLMLEEQRSFKKSSRGKPKPVNASPP